MDKVTLNILTFLISFLICFLVYLEIRLIVIPYWDKKDEKEKEKGNKENCSPTTQNTTLKSGLQVSTLEQDGIYYKPYFDKEKGLYIPMVVIDISPRNNPFGLIQKNIIYYQLIPLSVLSDIHNHFAEEINQALLKNNKENNNKENNKQGE